MLKCNALVFWFNKVYYYYYPWGGLEYTTTNCITSKLLNIINNYSLYSIRVIQTLQHYSIYVIIVHMHFKCLHNDKLTTKTKINMTWELNIVTTFVYSFKGLRLRNLWYNSCSTSSCGEHVKGIALAPDQFSNYLTLTRAAMPLSCTRHCCWAFPTARCKGTSASLSLHAIDSSITLGYGYTHDNFFFHPTRQD